MKNYKNWTKIDWDGNPDLKYKCYRKSFTPTGKGYVSIGIGKFTSIVYSYGANSQDSLCSTRWRANGTISEEKAIKIVDRNKGKYNYLDND